MLSKVAALKASHCSEAEQLTFIFVMESNIPYANIFCQVMQTGFAPGRPDLIPGPLIPVHLS